MGMPEQKKPSGKAFTTSLDHQIRQHLRTEARSAASSEHSEKLLQAIMYRAQFEIEQLPPLAAGDREEPDDAEALSAPPPAALMHGEDREKQRSSSRFYYYRELMDFKVLRTLGACTSILAMTR